MAMTPPKANPNAAALRRAREMYAARQQQNPADPMDNPEAYRQGVEKMQNQKAYGPTNFRDFVAGMGQKNKALSLQKKLNAWQYLQQKRGDVDPRVSAFEQDMQQQAASIEQAMQQAQNNQQQAQQQAVGVPMPIPPKGAPGVTKPSPSKDHAWDYKPWRPARPMRPGRPMRPVGDAVYNWMHSRKPR